MRDELEYYRYHIPNKKSDVKTMNDFKLFIKNRYKQPVKYGRR